jgi:hypothetical protein
MELELQSWKVKLTLVALIVLVVAVPLARASKSNKDRAEDWHRRAIVAEESVTGLRLVIADRSRELNLRTIQANRLATQLDTNGTALRRSKVSVGTLSKRQRALTQQNTRIERERAELQARLAVLETIAGKLRTCTRSLAAALAPSQGAVRPKTPAAAEQRLASCKLAGASYDVYLSRP